MGAYDAKVRVMPCLGCFAPTVVPRQAGTATCPRGHRFEAPTPSDAPIGRRVGLGEAERLARVAEDEDVPHLPLDQAVAAFDGKTTITAEESPPFWLKKYQQHTPGREGDLVLVHITSTCANSIASLQGQLGARATMEATLDKVDTADLRNELVLMLARGAARENDLESADAWLARADLKPVSAREDTAARLTRAIIALQRGQLSEALALVGDHEGAVASFSRMQSMAVMLRAHALELAGREDEARRELEVEMKRRDPGGAAALCQSAPIWSPMEICPRTLPPAAAAHFAEAVRSHPVVASPHAVKVFFGVMNGLAAVTFLIVGLSLGKWFMVGLSGVLLPVSLYLAVRGRSERPEQLRRRALRDNGVPALGRIRQLRYTGMQVNNRRVTQVGLDIPRPGGAPVAAWANCYVPRRDDHEWKVYAWIPVRVDPADPTIVVADAGLR